MFGIVSKLCVQYILNICIFYTSHPVVYCNNIISYSSPLTQQYIQRSILKIQRLVSVQRNHHQAKHEDTFLVHSESAHTMGSHIVYNCIDIKFHGLCIYNVYM